MSCAPVLRDAMQLRPGAFAEVQQALNVTYTQGKQESVECFRARVLKTIENDGKLRQLEDLLRDMV